jgi:hypothetical protein
MTTLVVNSLPTLEGPQPESSNWTAEQSRLPQYASGIEVSPIELTVHRRRQTVENPEAEDQWTLDLVS